MQYILPSDPQSPHILIVSTHLIRQQTIIHEAAILRSDGTILGESLASQHSIHQPFGGVVPSLAKSAHEDSIDNVIESALANAGMDVKDVDAIGVTAGPGLEICLRVGCERAKELARRYGKPFVAVHHVSNFCLWLLLSLTFLISKCSIFLQLEAHILMARIPPEKYNINQSTSAPTPYECAITSTSLPRAMEFPFLALLVSGGHCQILKCLGIGQYSIIGGTLDDSLGEAFDKTARLLGLPVGGGGGPAIEKLAQDGDPNSIPLPVPLQKRKDCDFSYAGLKTAVRLASEKLKVERGVDSVEHLPRKDKADIAASFQNTAFRHLEIRLERAMDLVEKEDGVRSLAVVGGVAANSELRSRLNGLCSGRSNAWEMFVPPPRLCTDQGAMSAWAAVERLMVGSSDMVDGQEVFARYPFAVVSSNSPPT